MLEFDWSAFGSTDKVRGYIYACIIIKMAVKPPTHVRNKLYISLSCKLFTLFSVLVLKFKE